jgi:hypothetical protein
MCDNENKITSFTMRHIACKLIKNLSLSARLQQQAFRHDTRERVPFVKEKQTRCRSGQ